VSKAGNKLVLNVEYSSIEFEPEAGLEIELPANTVQLKVLIKNVGELAANIRQVRPPEPLKAKEFVMKEFVRRKKLKLVSNAA
jgi:large subunit ribosomal protein L6